MKPDGVSVPDYIVAVDTLDCAVEVKRPESAHSAPSAMDKAASQIRDFGKPGFIALDLTDACFEPDWASSFMDEPGLLLDVVKPRFDQLATQLDRRVQGYNLSNKYTRVFGLAAFVRLHYWEKPDLTQPKARYLMSITSFRGAYSGLIFPQAEKFKRIFFEGAQEVAGGEVRKL